MPVSPWAYLCVQVAEVSRHDAHYIMTRMPLARAYQFRTLFWQMKGIACGPPEIETNSLETVIR